LPQQPVSSLKTMREQWATIIPADRLTLYSNRKFHVLFEKRGFKFKDGKAVTKEDAKKASAAAKTATPGKKSAGKKKIPADASDATADPTTPNKPIAKWARTKATRKIRKVEETIEVGDGGEDAVGDMEVSRRKVPRRRRKREILPTEGQ
jgi:hypothetical protein